MEQIKRFMKEEEGLELTEYAIMGALIIVVGGAAIVTIGGQINTVFEAIRTRLAEGITAI